MKGRSAMAMQQTDEGGRLPVINEQVVELLDEKECLSLTTVGVVGRIGYTSRFGPVVLPVNYEVHEGTIVFRTGLHSSMVEDLRTGIADAEYKVAFEIDQIRPATQEGWSVLVQGSAHFVDSEAELASLAHLGVQPWAGGPKEQFIRIVPTRITGRRIRRTPGLGAGLG
jgi:nitroimidazol reductase NimA-like FMN-containing flavoprotein (pyridoxamine 5'-phosphate oxidase superfamily)